MSDKEENESNNSLIINDNDAELLTADQKAGAINLSTLSVKSELRCLETFQAFDDWRMKQIPSDITQDLMCVYFEKLSREYKSNILIALHSQLKTVIKAKFNINIELYEKINHLLKINRIGYQSKQLCDFTAEDIKKFLIEAPDENYLPHKVSLIIGTSRACRGSLLHNFNLIGLEEIGNKVIELILFDTKNHDSRTFILEKPWSDLVKKYYNLRPENTISQKFFLKIQNGKCTFEDIDKNTIASWPREIATYLKLPNPEKYKGHSFRLISAAVLADIGCSILQEERMGNWEFVSVDESYIENSTTNRREISRIKQEFDEGEEESCEIPAKRSKLNSPVDELDESSSQESEEIQSAIIPVKSQQKYLKTFQAFDDWRNQQNPSDITENLMLVYMEKLSKEYKGTTVLSFHSHLKAVIKAKFNINIEWYENLNHFLKINKIGYHRIQPSVFTAEDIRKFLIEAPDEKYLPHKVALIIGSSGACQGSRLHDLNLSGLKDLGNKAMELTLFETKNGDNYRFTVKGLWYDYVKKYHDLRPKHTTSKKLFLNFQKGKCTVQNIGEKKIANWPQEIATYLKLPNTENFKEQSFRRTFTMLMADNEGSMLEMKRESISVAETYLDDSSNQENESNSSLTIDKDNAESLTVKQEAEQIELSSVPLKSRAAYLKTFQTFNEWRNKQIPPDITEDLIFLYIEKLSKEYKPNTVISIHSQLKTVINANFTIDIELYEKTNRFLKVNKKGYRPKKADVFTADEVKTFLNTAPDEKYLPHKVALIVGSSGACRGSRLHDLNLSGLKNLGNKVMELTLFETKNGDKYRFTIEGLWYDYVKKYHDLRPKHATSKKFFLNFQKGKCTVQNIGKNKIATWPREIATYLKLPNPETYKGLTFRRTSATILANSGGSMTEIKRTGGRKLTSTAESHVESSTTSRRGVSRKMKNIIEGEEENDEIPAKKNELNSPDNELNEFIDSKSTVNKAPSNNTYIFNNCTNINFSNA